MWTICRISGTEPSSVLLSQKNEIFELILYDVLQTDLLEDSFTALNNDIINVQCIILLYVYSIHVTFTTYTCNV